MFSRWEEGKRLNANQTKGLQRATGYSETAATAGPLLGSIVQVETQRPTEISAGINSN